MSVKFWIFILYILFGLILVFAWYYSPTASTSQVEIRAAMDIGSGATNMKIAKVDPKTEKIISIIFERSIPVAYQKQLEQSPDSTFNADIMNQGIKAIKTLKEIADQHQVKKVVAVATAAFRQASNSDSFVKEIKKMTGVDVKVISQDEEGFLAFRAALAKLPVSDERAVVWDIGGGSLQLTALSGHDFYHVDKGKTASTPFKNYIIEKIEGKNSAEIHSPNPMNEEQMRQAILYSMKLADESTSDYIKNKIKEKDTQVLAVGNLFNYGIRSTVGGKSEMTLDDLESAVLKLQGKSDRQISGDSFAEVAVSNPLLVLGYMKALSIEKVTILDVNNADGALTYPPFWETK